MFKSQLRVLVPLTGALLLTTGCRVEQTREAEAPDVDVSARGGQLPEYEVKQTKEGRMPDVDVDVKGGQMPAYDVDTPDVDIDTEKRTVTVPDIDIEMPEEEEGSS